MKGEITKHINPDGEFTEQPQQVWTVEQVFGVGYKIVRNGVKLNLYGFIPNKWLADYICETLNELNTLTESNRKLQAELDRFKVMLPDAIYKCYFVGVMDGGTETDEERIYKSPQDYYNRTDSELVKEVRDKL